jgi:hypothetical protein
MKYAIRQIKKEDLLETLKKMSKVFSAPPKDDEISAWVHEITENCPDKYKVFPINTADQEVQRPTKWVVKTEVLMATCGPDQRGYQLFTWSAWKDGQYRAHQFSNANAKTVDGLITRWLYTNMNTMVDCQREDTECTIDERSVLEEYDIDMQPRLHIGSEDKWKEHKNEDGEGGKPAIGDKKEINLDNSDKPLWNKPHDGHLTDGRIAHQGFMDWMFGSSKPKPVPVQVPVQVTVQVPESEPIKIEESTLTSPITPPPPPPKGKQIRFVPTRQNNRYN